MRLYGALALGVVIVGAVSAGVFVEVRSLGWVAALQVLPPAGLFLAGLYVLWRDEASD